MKTYSLYLNSEWVVNSPFIDVSNPANGETIAHVSTIDRATLTQAIDHAHAAFKSWRKLTGKARGAFLYRIADGVEQRSTKIGSASIFRQSIGPVS